MTRTSLCSLVTITGHWLFPYYWLSPCTTTVGGTRIFCSTVVPVRVAQLQLKTPVLTTSCLMHALDVPNACPIYASARSSTTVACQGSNQGTEKSWQKASASYKGAGHQPWQIPARLLSKTRQLPIIRCRGGKAPFTLKTSLYSVQWAQERVLS